MNKLSLKPVTLFCSGTAATALLACAAWAHATGYFSAPQLAHSAPLPAWHTASEYTGHHHLNKMSEAERAALVRLQLATANGRWFP